MLGLVTTVKNEVRLLRRNLLYHRWLGVERVYVYDDGCEDGTGASVADLPDVLFLPTVPPDAYAGRPELEWVVAHHGDHVVSRQVLNTLDAQRRAEEDGLRWLLFSDVDELILPPGGARPGALREHLAGLPAEVEAVRFLPLECVQDVMERADPYDVGLFKDASVRIRRSCPDPLTRRMHRFDWIYGHKKGKSIVRLGLDAFPRNPHRFGHRDGRKLRERVERWVLHYKFSDFGGFLQHQRLHEYGTEDVVRVPIMPARLFFSQLARVLDEEELARYYERWLLFSPAELFRLRLRGLVGRAPLVAAPDLLPVLRDVAPCRAPPTAGGASSHGGSR